MRKRVYIYVHEADVTKVYKKIQDTTGLLFADLGVGDCGWKNAPDCWWICFRGTKKQREEIMQWIDRESVELYDITLIK